LLRGLGLFRRLIRLLKGGTEPVDLFLHGLPRRKEAGTWRGLRSFLCGEQERHG
jgi:hypothetical protein